MIIKLSFQLADVEVLNELSLGETELSRKDEKLSLICVPPSPSYIS